MDKPFEKMISDKSSASGITSDELYRKLKTDNSLQLLDLRSEADYQYGHIQGSARVSSYIRTDIGILPKVENTENETVLICRDGKESMQYVELLNKIGKNVRYLVGGFKNWNHSLYHPSYLT